ncbi:two-component system chemotaxis response regulator CheB [Altererythrobacter atlanticus]|uniref:Protein-glutamate methylesterase/protein-glutamine glutaminase n=1 Tax=Croceibacterium atlanticum TaxID=1267766 RepID=A0A0F7KWV5_9SPHN|nr:chemotaxis-specific protein-glutamate methyltransferase CheB [Croceibacterium atlanticum]AKH43676.1 Chemotaxis response regulator protein-glutamate methylesterase [Croceibacterium atlanticum]MBB5733840.1 two-component system chemotaxis response regulator CheB [Croceibacterium atlanticum]
MNAVSNIAIRFRPGSKGLDAIRVLAVDDSPVVRSVYRKLVSQEPDMVLAGSAGSAEEALVLLDTVEADVILLDLEMPGMGGMDAIPRIIAKSAPARILVVSSLSVKGADHTLAALSLGAADTLAKPRPGEFDKNYRETLLRRIRLLGRVAKRVRVRSSAPLPAILRRQDTCAPEVIAIGASTGGIHAIGQFLGALPASVTLPILITQHLPPTFSGALARQLHAASGREVLVAENRQKLMPGKIILAPGNAHLTLVVGPDGEPVVRLDRHPVANGCMPSVDRMFSTCAQVLGNKVLAVVLSGMGRDGMLGAACIVEKGGSVFAQDAESSAVWGMPGAVAAAGLAAGVMPPEQIAMRAAASVSRT